MKLILFCAAALAVASPLSAHIVFADNSAQPGATYTGALRVGHGCGEAATTAISVTIPAGINGAKPQAKAGWAVEIAREPQTQRVKTITWRGRLPIDQFDDFGLSLPLPQTPGPLYFPTLQSCETGENRWVEVPAAGAAWNSVPRPAPVLNLAAPAHDMAAMPGMDHGRH